MQLLTTSLTQKIQSEVVENLQHQDFQRATQAITEILAEMYANIPANKRISYGVVYTIKQLTDTLFPLLKTEGLSIPGIAPKLIKHSNDWRCQGVVLGLLTNYGLDHFNEVLPYFEEMAASEQWELREITQMFFKRFIKKNPEAAQQFLLTLAQSPDPNIRRFVAETLRPVQENRWFYRQSEYSLSVLRHLFAESATYPRTAVGNNLSDLARQLPDLVYEIVRELVASGNRNSYWIAYRACRNLVKHEPLKVMDLLQVAEYRYKQRVYRRSDYT